MFEASGKNFTENKEINEDKEDKENILIPKKDEYMIEPKKETENKTVFKIDKRLNKENKESIDNENNKENKVIKREYKESTENKDDKVNKDNKENKDLFNIINKMHFKLPFKESKVVLKCNKIYLYKLNSIYIKHIN